MIMQPRTVTPLRWVADELWHSVQDCLPEPLVDVWVCYTHRDAEQDIAQAYRKPDGRWVLTGSDPDIAIHPSHWMAQPLPPVGGDDGAKTLRAVA